MNWALITKELVEQGFTDDEIAKVIHLIMTIRICIKNRMGRAEKESVYNEGRY